MTRLPENPDERRAFDYGVETYAGNALRWMAVMVANWATIERGLHPGGTYGEQLAIMANELDKVADGQKSDSA